VLPTFRMYNCRWYSPPSSSDSFCTCEPAQSRRVQGEGRVHADSERAKPARTACTSGFSVSFTYCSAKTANSCRGNHALNPGQMRMPVLAICILPMNALAGCTVPDSHLFQELRDARRVAGECRHALVDQDQVADPPVTPHSCSSMRVCHCSGCSSSAVSTNLQVFRSRTGFIRQLTERTKGLVCGSIH
jgi:hypothetical protein